MELVARVSAPSDGGLESIRVSLDGRRIDRWRPGMRLGYQDYVARVPPDAERPHVSAITLEFDASTDDDVLAKLDRISARVR